MGLVEGQQAQDGGQTVQLLLDVLWQLLALLVPEETTNVKESCSCTQTYKVTTRLFCSTW